MWRSVYVGATLENVRGAKTGGASGQVKGQRRLGCGGGRVWLSVWGSEWGRVKVGSPLSALGASGFGADAGLLLIVLGF